MKLCLIYNYAQHYRTNIFTLMDKNLDIDFYFGDDMGDVIKMDYTLLHNKVTEVKNRKFGRAEWQSGVISLAFRDYDGFIILGTPMCVSTWICSIIARLRGKKVLFWTHGWYGKESALKKRILKVFYRIPNSVLLYGNYAKKLMIKEGFNSKSLSVIHNSLLYDEQLDIRKTLSKSKIYSEYFNNDFPVVIFVGRLNLVKKLDMLLYALKQSLDENFIYNVVIIGGGEHKAELEQLTSKLELNKYVRFYGPCYNEKELSHLIYNADLCVAPGNIGLTAMHSMAYGCPCISHNDFAWQMPEFEAIKEGETGSFFERDNIEDLATKIKLWLTTRGSNRELVRKACFKEIDEQWNPHVQLTIIQKTINS